MSSMLKKSKENSENLTKLSGHDGKIDSPTLLKTVNNSKDEVEQFVGIHRLDQKNEKFPI